MRRPLLLILALTLGLAACRTASVPPVEAPVPVAPVPQAAPQLIADVSMLASDAFEGRGAGTPGGYRAADFVERRFRERGLTGAFDGRFRQAVDDEPGHDP